MEVARKTKEKILQVASCILIVFTELTVIIRYSFAYAFLNVEADDSELTRRIAKS